MKRLLPVGAIIFLCAIFFYPVLFQGKLPVPTDTLIGLYYPWYQKIPFKNFLITDPIRQQIPWKKLVIDQWKSGTVPTYNPYNFSGTPLSGNIQAAAFYPLNMLFILFPFMWAWVILVMLQPFLAAVFLYMFLRSKKIHPAAALLGGISWAFCGFSVAWLTWGTIVQTALWLPLMFLAIDRISETRKKLLWTIVLTVAVSMAFFAGHAQVALYVFIIAAVYALTRYSRWIILASALTVAITSIQWVPMLQLVSRSARFTDPSVWQKEGWFVPWQHLIQFIAPDFFGNPSTLNYWGAWNYGEFIGYIGILPMIFALYALLVRKDRITKFFGITVGIVLLFLLPTPLAKLPYQWSIPLWSTLQPTRLMVLVDVSLVTLAALGLDHFIRKPHKRMAISAGIVGFILAGLWIFTLTGPVSDNLFVARRNLILPSTLTVLGVILVFLYRRLHYTVLFSVAVIALTVFDLFRFGWKFTPFTPKEYFFPSTNVVSFLQSQEKPFRVMSLDARILPPNVNAYYGIESPEGYDPVYDGRYEEFIAALNRNEPNIMPPFGFNRIITLSTLDSPLVPLLNVKYILSLDDQRRPDLELMYQEGETNVYWYKKAMPRMWNVETVIPVSSKQQVMDMLYDTTFDPTTTVVVEEPVTLGSDQQFKVVSSVYDSRWSAFVDGVPTKIYRANFAFFGFVVPTGDHTVDLRYN